MGLDPAKIHVAGRVYSSSAMTGPTNISGKMTYSIQRNIASSTPNIRLKFIDF